MKSIRIIHTADVHLGCKFPEYNNNSSLYDTEKREEELKETFHKIITMCVKNDADVLLIAGDLFDSSMPDMELISFVAKEFNRIPEVSVFIAPGNHDYYVPGAFYDFLLKNCKNLYVFKEKTDYMELEIRDCVVRVYGGAFTTPEENTCMIDADLIRNATGDADINIGVFHGTVDGGNSYPAYNPIPKSLIGETGLDYMALGHIHKPGKICESGDVSYGYCGCPEGMSFNETGNRGVYMGNIYHKRADMRFIPVSKRKYKSYTMDLTGVDLEEISADYDKAVAQVINEKIGGRFTDLYRITLKGEVDYDIDTDRIRDFIVNVYYLELKDETEGIYRDESYMELDDSSGAGSFENDFYGGQSFAGDEKYDADVFEGESKRKARRSIVIESVNIDSFGGLKNFTKNFNKGFNYYYGGNEYGKTTVTAFVKLMFYGGNKKSKDPLKNPRRRFTPLDGSVMSGSMVISVYGDSSKKYKITKIFGGTRGEDRCAVYNITDGVSESINPGTEVGEYFLGLKEEEYDKMVRAFDENALTKNDMNINILMGGSEEEGERMTAIRRKMEKIRSKRGDKGEIAALNDKINLYNVEIKHLKKELSDVTGMDIDSGNPDKRNSRRGSSITSVDDVEDYLDNQYGKYKRAYVRSRVLTIILFAVTVLVIGILKINEFPYITEALILGVLVVAIEMCTTMFNKSKMQQLEEYEYDGELIDKITGEIEDYEIKLNECYEEKVALVDEYNSLFNIYKEEKEKRDALIRQFWIPVKNKTVELINRVWDKKLRDMSLDKEGNIMVLRDGDNDFRDWKCLSVSTKRTLYLVMGLVIREEMYGEIVFPLILDDVLNVCDRDREERMTDVLKGINNQVILFSSRKEAADVGVIQ